MSGAKADYASPPWSLRVWVDFTYLYLEIPGAGDKPPYIEKYPLTGDGFVKALGLLKAIHAELAPPSGYTPIEFPITRGKISGQFSKNQREAARQVLAKLGLKASG